MSYAPPNGDAIAFTFVGQPAYTTPTGDAIAFSFVPTSTEGGPLAMAAQAVIDLVATSALVIQAKLPLQAACTLGLFLVGTLREIGALLMQAKGTLLLLAKRSAPQPPRGLGMKMHVISDPNRPGVILDQFLRVWFNGTPSAVRISYQVDDQPETQPATVWENPGTTQPAILRIDGAEIPGDGLTHRVTVSAWQQVGTTVSPKATLSDYLSTPDRRPLVSPAWCGATLKRQATGLAYHSTGIFPDLVEIKWRHTGAVALFAKRLVGSREKIARVGMADHQEESYLAEGVSALMGYTANPVDVWMGVAAIARGTYGAITWQTKPIQLKGFDDFQLPTPVNPDAATRQDLVRAHIAAAVMNALSAELVASAPANLGTIADKVYDKLIYRIKDVTRKGGTVELDDCGTFKAGWGVNGRSVGFTPSLGFKAGTKLGKPLTDAQAKEIT